MDSLILSVTGMVDDTAHEAVQLLKSQPQMKSLVIKLETKLKFDLPADSVETIRTLLNEVSILSGRTLSAPGVSTLASEVEAGGTALKLTSSIGFRPGTIAMIGLAGDETCERVVIDELGSLRLQEPLKHAHCIGEVVISMMLLQSSESDN